MLAILRDETELGHGTKRVESLFELLYINVHIIFVIHIMESTGVTYSFPTNLVQ